MQAIRKITRVIDAISEFTGRAVAWLCLVVVLVGAFNAIARYTAGWLNFQFKYANTLGDAQWQMFAAIFLLGGAYTLKHGAHVRVDVLSDRFGPKLRCWVNLTGYLVLLIPFCVFLIWSTFPYALKSWKELEVSGDPGGLPVFPVKTLMPLGFSLLLIQGIGETLKQIQQLLTGEFEGGDEKKEEVSA
ncbi:MAG: TRAP-type mannitol/chloroaromatic compound transport system permease small subunit [Verrucomicrobiales bacterium]